MPASLVCVQLRMRTLALSMCEPCIPLLEGGPSPSFMMFSSHMAMCGGSSTGPGQQ